MVVVEIQTDLPHRHDALVARERVDLGEHRVVRLFRIVRMHTDGRDDVSMRVRERDCVPRLRRRLAHADDDEAGNSRGSRALEDMRRRRTQRLARRIEMTVRIDEHSVVSLP